MTTSITVRSLAEADCVPISQAFAAQGWQKPSSHYVRYFQESMAGTRTVLVAEYASCFAGYLTVVWDSSYPPFQADHIPEILDFNVLMCYQRRGVGSALMDTAEQRIARRSPIAGIGVGVTADYGAAQVLYVKRGYVPDGRGLCQDGRHLCYGQPALVNDDLVLFFTKRLSAASVSNLAANTQNASWPPG